MRTHEIPASHLQPGQAYRDDTDDTWHDVTAVELHGDTVLVTYDLGAQTSFDLDTVLECRNLPERTWTVTFTKDVSARTAIEAISRADDGKGGGNWEAQPEPLMTTRRALDFAIFALNTIAHPDASAQDDVDRLDDNHELVVDTLVALRSGLPS